MLIVTRCKLSERRAQEAMHTFQVAMQYADIGYNTTKDGADVIVATMPQTKQHKSLGTKITYTAGLPDHAAWHDDCDADIIAANRRSVLTASFSDIPIDILAASDEADSAQVIQKLDELRKDGRHTSRHTIFITTTQQTSRQHSAITSHNPNLDIRGAYKVLNDDAYGYDYPV